MDYGRIIDVGCCKNQEAQFAGWKVTISNWSFLIRKSRPMCENHCGRLKRDQV